MNVSIFVKTAFDFLTTAIFVVVFIRIILSWIPNTSNAFTQIIYDITEPLLKPFRFFNPKNSPLDLSPIILLILIEILRNLLNQIL